MTYSAHPSVAYVQAILDNLQTKTGKSLDEWLALLEQTNLSDEKSRRAWLQQTQQLGGTSAAMIAARSMATGLEDMDAAAYLAAAPRYVETMYQGKESLRPAHDRILDLAVEAFPEVKICPCTTMVPLYRRHVFAQVKPATKTRLELGLCLKGYAGPLSSRLVDTGGLQKGDRITHRFNLAPGEMPDAEMLDWLKIAYDLDVK